MIATLGRFSLALALGIALYGALVSILGAHRRKPVLIESGRGVPSDVASIFYNFIIVERYVFWGRRYEENMEWA